RALHPFPTRRSSDLRTVLPPVSTGRSARAGDATAADHCVVQRLVPPFARPASDVAASLGVDPSTGLSEAEAAARLIADGPNELRSEEHTSELQSRFD